MNRGLSFNTKGSALNPTFSPVRPSLEMKKWHGFEPRLAPKHEMRPFVADAHEGRITCANFKIDESKIKRRNRWYRMYKKRPRWLINVVERLRKWVEKTVITVRLSQTTAKQILNRLKETYELLRKKPEEQVQKFGKSGYSH